MTNVDHRRIDNQHRDLLSAPEAAEYLGIKLPTLYAYTSRGLVKSFPSGSGRARRYAKDDLDRLKARHDARSGHGPVAGAALRWGEPVLESAITGIGPKGPAYRGQVAVELAARGLPFECVAELLISGGLPSEPPKFHAPKGINPRGVASLLPSPAPILSGAALLLPLFAARDPGRFGSTTEADRERARRIVRIVAASVALPDEERYERAIREETIAGSLAAALGRAPSKETRRAIDVALIVCGDHELNPSSFASRVAASAEADLYACASAALATLSGPRHGGMTFRVEALVAEVGQPERAAAVVGERAMRGENVPGFGHTLYPQGDPRTPPLLELAKALAPKRKEVRILFALADAMRESGREPPAVDLGLVALDQALGLGSGAALAMFAVGRSAGWMAHALEQRAAPHTLRPRARYVGP